MYGQSLTSCWLKHIGTACVWCFCLQQWKKSSFFPVCKGVPRRQPHRRSGLATCPLWEPSPSHPVLLYTRGFAVFLCLLFDYCMFDFSVYYIYLQYFDTVGWVLTCKNRPPYWWGHKKNAHSNPSIFPLLFKKSDWRVFELHLYRCYINEVSLLWVEMFVVCSHVLMLMFVNRVLLMARLFIGRGVLSCMISVSALHWSACLLLMVNAFWKRYSGFEIYFYCNHNCI